MFETSSESPASVRVVSEAIKEYVERLGPIWIEGEISELNERSGGMAFMRLRDTSVDMSLSVMCYKNVLAAVQPLPANARVVIHAKASWFTKNGSLTMSAKEIRQVGVGELLARLEALKGVLAAEGLFSADRKVALPKLPRKVGLICGRNTDAEKDVVENARRRWPAVEFEIREVAVQGSAAVVEVSAALRELESMDEVDEEISDINKIRDRMYRRLLSSVEYELNQIAQLRNRPVMKDPSVMIKVRKDDLSALRDRSHRGFKALLDIEKKEIKGVIAHLRSLSPQSTMDRGYSVVQSDDGKIVRDATKLKAGSVLRIRAAKGEAKASVLASE